MSLFFGRRQARASVVEAQDLIPSRSSGPSFAEPVTEKSAASVVAYSAATNLLAGIISSLPLRVYVGTGVDQRPASNVPTWLDDPGGQGYGFEDWAKLWVVSGAYTGNVCNEVAMRDGNGLPSVLVIQPPTVVTFRDGTWWVEGRRITRGDLLHYRRFPVPGQRFGRSPIVAHATTFSLALSAERFGAQWFQEGAHPSQVLETDEVVDAEIAEKIQARVLDVMRGSRGPAVLGAGMKLNQFQVAPEESQFLETQGYTAAQACRILGPGLAEILGYKTGDSLTYKNREQMALDLLAYTVDPWLVDLERFITRALNAPGTRGGRWVSFDREALLRTDVLTRFQAYRLALGPQEPFMVANEARANEDGLSNVPWGDDKPTVQGSTATPEAPQDTPDDTGLRSLTVNMPAVNVATPDVTVNTPDVTVNVPPTDPPVVNIRQDAPTVNVEAPTVNVEAPTVNVEAELRQAPAAPVTRRVERDTDGHIVQIIEEPT